MMKSKHRISPYEVLQVHPKASDEVIAAAYRALLRKAEVGGTRPDKEAIDDLGEVYELLSDPDRRAEYDKDRKRFVGSYEILKVVAEGGFGKTYKARHVELDEFVCIKDCSKVKLKKAHLLVEEARALWNLSHYALPSARDILRLDDGSFALVMAWARGLTISQIVERSRFGKVDTESVAWITERILNALVYIHYHRVIHGDVKPHNIIVHQPTHTATLVDFGLSLIRPKPEGELSKGTTLLYASPEELANEPITLASDLYSLGLTMIYALTGKEESVARREIPTECPKPLAEFIERLIVRDPRGRPRWKEENLCETIKEVRIQVFGREHSGMKPIDGLDFDEE